MRKNLDGTVGARDAWPELPRAQARHLLSRGGHAGDQAEGRAAQGSVG